MLQIGLSHELSTTITTAHLATQVESGDVDVLATPIMIALMEKTAMQSIAPALENHQTSVGTHINIRHMAPSIEGQEIRVVSKISNLSGKRIEFEVKAWAGDVLIGEGTHRRIIVDRSAFMSRAVALADNAEPST